MSPAASPRPQTGRLDWPLMKNNLARADLDAVIELLRQDDPILTHAKNVRAFEAEWSAWIGVPHSVYVNSGASANLLTLAAIRELRGPGEIIVAPLGWVSDIAAVLQNGFQPVVPDVNPRTLGMDTRQILERITPRTRAVFLTHVLGFNALTDELLAELSRRNIPLIEDACESYGATFHGRKVGTFGLAANFSFYYAHHLTTIEGGMISTADAELYQVLRMLRSHGMIREASAPELRERYCREHADLSPDFIFAFPGYNVRPTEIGAVIGRSQLKRLDDNNRRRIHNFSVFLAELDPAYYVTDFDVAGSCNYAFVVILRRPDEQLRDRVMATLRENGVEFRRGTAGGGNQLRQPYLKRVLGEPDVAQYPAVEHIHFFGFYIGNYPELPEEKIRALAALLNNTARQAS
jgi:CDP-6-deoxy-D-xylo-4-hexulose-3-dehydrase